MLRLIWAICLTLLAGPVLAQTVERGPAPGWVRAIDADAVPVVDRSGAPFRILVWDHQIHVDDQATHAWSRTRTLIQSTTGLAAAGTVSAAWKPGSQTLTVHAVNILRGDQVIDVLATQSFEVLRREQNLESSMLDGVLTATLQPADLRVGDVLEVITTISNHDPVTGRHGEYILGGQFGVPVERFHVRMTWPSDRPVRVRAVAPWTLPTPRRGPAGYSVELDIRDLAPLEIPTNTPVRFQHARQIELTEYRDWTDIADLMRPLFERAAVLEPGSPLHAEIERIAQAHAAPADRAAAALRLVQDDVRYLALAMGEGGYVPASADETWRRRFGDCKGKTALLMALLRGLGIEAEAALVSTAFGDGLNERLPLLTLFDHVIVRTVIDGQVYWIDGTRIGDRAIADAAVPAYHWSAPLRAGGPGLEAMPVRPLRSPALQISLAFDSSAGLDAPSALVGEMVMSGETALALQAGLANLSATERDEGLRTLWAQAAEGFEVDSAAAVYDDEAGLLRMTMTGSGRLPWTSMGAGRRLEFPETIMSFPIAPAREAGPYADLPYVVAHPSYIRSTITVKLPPGVAGFSTEGADIDEELGGYSLRRTTTLVDDLVTITLSARSLVGELTAEQTEAARVRYAALESAPVALLASSAYRPTEADAAALSTETDNVDTLIQRGEILRARGDHRGALAAFDRAVELSPGSAGAHVSRGGLLLDRGEFARARADLERAVELEPGGVLATNLLGFLAMQEGRFDDAVLEFTVALRLQRDDLGALMNRAWAYRRMGRHDRALADYRAALALDDAQWGIRVQELETLREMGRGEEADGQIAARLAADPADAAALQARMAAAIKAGTPEDALPALDAAVAAGPDRMEIRGFRAEARARSGDAAGALEDIAAIRAAAGTGPTELNNLCWTQARLGLNLDQALADCEAALAAVPGSPSYLDSRAMVRLHQGRLAEALADYEAALEGAPRQAASLYGRGLAREAMGDAAGGAVDKAAALAIDPEAAADFDMFVRARGGAPAGE
ncbi:tetratricopeptide repeat protein [Brevundimonas sp.]|uniref:tetratricopeptide repeat protein n=1 Tax=Brevundimonas sp. TaxID=1871086 RepID=UPI002ED7AC30